MSVNEQKNRAKTKIDNLILVMMHKKKHNNNKSNRFLFEIQNDEFLFY